MVEEDVFTSPVENEINTNENGFEEIDEDNDNGGTYLDNEDDDTPNGDDNDDHPNPLPPS